MSSSLSPPPFSSMPPMDDFGLDVDLDDISLDQPFSSDAVPDAVSAAKPGIVRRWGGRKLSKKALAEMAAFGPSKAFNIPYFAHQELDPTKYICNVHLPVGGPPEQHFHESDWNESESERDEDASIHGSDLDETGYCVPKAKRKKRKSAVGTKSDETGPKPRSYKNMRLEGGRPPLAKRVTADLDSDDELIVRMKQAKYPEKVIAERLKAEGRTCYNHKSISGRWNRIKKALQKKQDERLDADLSDWHEGDDEVLAKAIDQADAEVRKLKQQVEARRWQMVADNMKTLRPVVDFSQNACRNRYEDLQKGIAKPTPEEIANPDENVRARRQFRIDKQKRIDDTKAERDMFTRNLEQNAWNSSWKRS